MEALHNPSTARPSAKLYFYARRALKRLNLDEFCELSVQIGVVERSRYACIPFLRIGIKKNIREHAKHSPEATMWAISPKSPRPHTHHCRLRDHELLLTDLI